MASPRIPLFIALSLATHGLVAAAVLVHPKAPPSLTPPPPVLAGDTFDVSMSEVPVPQDQALPPPKNDPATDNPNVGQEPGAGTRPKAPPRAAPTAAPGASASSATNAADPNALTFGAVGDRSAVDVAVAFTRSFPQASSADPFWATVPLGDCGATDVTFVLAEDGTLASWSASGAPTEALSRAVSRTVALIKSRSFLALGPTTKLRVSAKVTADEVHDGLHGDVFAVGGSFAGGEGSAFFALAIGRRVDVTVRAVR